MKLNKNQILGLIIVVIGITGIIIAQTADFPYETHANVPNPFGQGSIRMPDTKYNHELKNGLLYGGIAASILGSIITLMSSRK